MFRDTTDPGTTYAQDLQLTWNRLVVPDMLTGLTNGKLRLQVCRVRSFGIQFWNPPWRNGVIVVFEV